MGAFSHGARGKPADVAKQLAEHNERTNDAAAGGSVDAATGKLMVEATKAANKLAELVGGDVDVTVYGRVDGDVAGVTVGVRRVEPSGAKRSGAKTPARKTGRKRAAR